MAVLQHDLRIVDYHNVGRNVVENGLELLLLLSDPFFVQKKVDFVFIDGVYVAFK